MANLNDDLSHFARAIVQGEAPSSQLNSGDLNYSIDTAIEVYRNNYRGNLHDALAGAYPVIKQLVGDDFFRMLALKFIGKYPSRSANLHHYGVELAEFLTHFAPAKELVYLPDVATLEWACHIAYLDKDEPLFDLGRLANIPPEQHPDLIFILHPAVRIVRSAYPIIAIWQAHQPGADSEFQIDLNDGHCIALVYRKDDAVQISGLEEAEAEWLELTQAGQPLGTATMATLDRFPDFDLQATLIKLVTQNVLIDLR